MPEEFKDKVRELINQREEEKKQEIEKDFQIETIRDIIDDELPEEQWIIDRVLPDDGFTFIVGAEATGKSFYTLSIANSVTTGQDWLSKFPVSKQTKVLFMDKENSRRRIQSRSKGLGITDTENKIFRIKTPHLFNLLDPKGNPTPYATYISNKVIENNIGLIILDSFADFMIGNENSADDVQIFFNTMRLLFPNKAILVLHHENKPSQAISRTSSQRVRGSTNITAQIICGFRVFSIPKTSNEFVLEQFKAGDSEKLKPFKVQLVSKPYPYNPDKTYVSEVKYTGEYYDEEGKAELAEDLILDFVTENPGCNRKELLAYLTDNNIGSRTADKVIKELVDDKKLKKERIGLLLIYTIGDN